MTIRLRVPCVRPTCGCGRRRAQPPAAPGRHRSPDATPRRRRRRSASCDGVDGRRDAGSRRGAQALSTRPGRTAVPRLDAPSRAAGACAPVTRPSGVALSRPQAGRASGERVQVLDEGPDRSVESLHLRVGRVDQVVLIRNGGRSVALAGEQAHGAPRAAGTALRAARYSRQSGRASLAPAARRASTDPGTGHAARSTDAAIGAVHDGRPRSRRQKDR